MIAAQAPDLPRFPDLPAGRYHGDDVGRAPDAAAAARMRTWPTASP
jgi:hypothetical protein